MKTHPNLVPLSFVLFLFLSFHATAIVHFEQFDQDPSWDGLNNFSQIGMRSVVQDFGYRTTANCNALPGEVGDTITPDARPAYCAKPLAALSLNDSFTASGKILVGQGGGNTLLGFFNPATANEWRMANSVVFRFYGRSNIFQAHVEYGTSLWRAGAGMFPADFTSGTVYAWSLTYTPIGAASGRWRNPDAFWID